MIITRTVTKKVEETADVFCNNCGQSCMRQITTGIQDAYGLIEVEVSGGYMSTHLEDMTAYRFSVCEKCLQGYFDNFVIAPEKRELL